MRPGLIRKVSSCAAALLLALALGVAALVACGPIVLPTVAQTDAPPLPPAQLDAILAPVALYPDPLLAQVLMAATYPAEIADAAAWQQANGALAGGQLAAAVEQLPWDPSVKSLLQFPQVLQMLAANPQWVEQLGNAFLVQQADVAASVQRLRHLALAAGTLRSTPQQTVLVQGDIITIEPAAPQMVYMPIYNPGAVYGAWPYPEPPDELPPPPGYIFGLGIGFGIGYAIVDTLWGWESWDWGRREIRIDRDRYDRIAGDHGRAAGTDWRHDWGHSATRASRPAQAPAARQDFRGYAGAAPSPPALESFGRGAEVRSQAARGQASRASAPAPMRSAPARGGGGGGRGGGRR